MILRRSPFILLVLVLALAGCRDALVDAPPDPIDPVDLPPATEEVPALYVKGPVEMEVGDQTVFRSEVVTGVVLYRWRLLDTSTGRLLGTSSQLSGVNRLFEATASREGLVGLVVQAYDDEGALLASTTKYVNVVAP